MDAFNKLNVSEDVKQSLRAIKKEVDAAYKDSIEYQNKLLVSAAKLLNSVTDGDSLTNATMLDRLPKLKMWYIEHRNAQKAEKPKRKKK